MNEVYTHGFRDQELGRLARAALSATRAIRRDRGTHVGVLLDAAKLLKDCATREREHMFQTKIENATELKDLLTGMAAKAPEPKRKSELLDLAATASKRVAGLKNEHLAWMKSTKVGERNDGRQPSGNDDRQPARTGKFRSVGGRWVKV